MFEAATCEDGWLPAAVRRDIIAGTIPDPLREFVQRVGARPSSVDTSDLEALRRMGMAEEAIFELVICAALGAAQRRMAAGIVAVGAAETHRVPTGGE